MRSTPIKGILLAALLLCTTLACDSYATTTENLGIRVLPVPGKVNVDGNADDWDLSGGVFACGNVETQRDTFGLWFHLMYDPENLYILSRVTDLHPLDNTRDPRAEDGWYGDCLQFRIVTSPGTPGEQFSHLTCWHGKGGLDVIDIAYGQDFKKGNIKDAQTMGGKQSFAKNADGKGYTQEISVPWSLLTADKKAPGAGAKATATVELFFQGGMSTKEIWKPGVTPNRVFTFMASDTWGPAVFESDGKVKPAPVRLADGREFPVSMADGAPSVAWAGLVRSKQAGGVIPLEFNLPGDGFVCLNIYGSDGAVARQLLTCHPFPKGQNVVHWDALTSPSCDVPGKPVQPGAYMWRALWHTGIGLRLNGWAHNSGSKPWDDGSGTSSWGGDHGHPCAVAVDKDTVYLGWTGAEAGKSLLAADLEGRIKWSNIRGGIGGVKGIGVDNGTVYVLGGTSGEQSEGGNVYRLDAKDGSYTMWEGSDSTDLNLGRIAGFQKKADAIAVAGGRVFLAFRDNDLIGVLDGKSGKLEKTIAVSQPVALCARDAGHIMAICGGKSVNSVNVASGKATPVVSGLSSATAIAVDSEGRIYVGSQDDDRQVKVFSGAGKLTGTIGRKGGRPLIGKWIADGMNFIQGLGVDAAGMLWVAEADKYPKRVTAWNTGSGRLLKEFFGPTDYGATGGCILPSDPTIMAGQGCEWKIDPQTGQASCAGVVTRGGMGISRFRTGSNGKTYLFVSPKWLSGGDSLEVYERLAPGSYKLRTVLRNNTSCWADANDDGREQGDEIVRVGGSIDPAYGWTMGVDGALSVVGYSNDRKTHAILRVSSFTACGAPVYDMNKAIYLPSVGRKVCAVPSSDGRIVVCDGAYEAAHTTFDAIEVASGRTLWRYPNNYVGVHGSHKSPPSDIGLIRGAMFVADGMNLPGPVKAVFAVPTNVGEWHLLTADGFYLTRLFQGDLLNVKWAEKAVPGSDMTQTPPGMGGEDFGGSMVLGTNGRLYVQAGKTAFWNLEVTGLDTVKAIEGGKIEITADVLARAEEYRKNAASGPTAVSDRLKAKKMTPAFTGVLAKDFAGVEPLRFSKKLEAAVSVAAAVGLNSP